MNDGKCTVLGLDLGANSLGWALIGFEDGKPREIIAAGSRVFEAGVEGDIEQGRDESRAASRRAARQVRRQTWRQAHRMGKVASVLQKAGLLPGGDVLVGHKRDALMKSLDQDLYAHFKNDTANNGQALDQLPYFLRARALYEKLDPHALGRAIYHLAQRRGFLSNRKTDKDDKETGVVKEGIHELEAAISAAGVRTLGEFFANTDPVYEKRIRARWTARAMYEQEFEALWEAQRQHYPDLLTVNLKKKIHHAIFYQRPLKSQKGLVGHCELEPDQRRAPWALLPAQRFRLLQKVNDLTVISPEGIERRLSDPERTRILEALEHTEKLTFPQARKLLESRPKGTEFNLERGGNKDIPGNKTAARLREVFGDRWDELSYDDQQAIVGEVLGIKTKEALIRRGRERWGLKEEEALARFAKVNLESGYCALSKKALKAVLPRMEEGVSFATARKECYNDLTTRLVCDELPSVWDAGIDLRNPAVMRSLTQLRKVVNAIIRKYGKPGEIHVELARDLKRGREERKEIWQNNRKREKNRDEARTFLRKDMGIPNPSRDDIEKYLLWKECGEKCPYTGKSISATALFGQNPQFDVEHIVPFSRCLDNSFANKTLCYHEENRARKKNGTPFEVYGGNEDEWQAIIQRVSDFQGEAAKSKLKRFQTRELDAFDEFATQKLNDTRYASRLAVRYLSWLYGDEALKRIQVSTGQITAYLRTAWKLNRVLNTDNTKSRDDHRHHAVDAIVIALINRSTVKRISDAAKKKQHDKGRVRGWEREMKEPWQGFFQQVEKVVGEIVVSHRTSHKVMGRLHEDTFYSPPRQDEQGKQYVVVRKKLDATFQAADIDKVVDPRIQQILRDWLDKHTGNAKQAFSDPSNHPYITISSGPKAGKRIPIHRVRIRRNISVFPVGSHGAPRYVTSDSNHHMAIFQTTDKRGNPKWFGELVSRFEAVERSRRHEPVVHKTSTEIADAHFLFTLAPNDIIALDGDNGNPKLCIVRSISKDLVEFAGVTDSRIKEDIRAANDWGKRRVNGLRALGCRKMTVTPLGEIHPAND